MVPIYKDKGDLQDSANYRGIKLMSCTIKIWEKLIKKRLETNRQ